jgi:hypothetical protein
LLSSIGPPVVARLGFNAVISSTSLFAASSFDRRNAHSSNVMQIAVDPRLNRQLAGLRLHRQPIVQRDGRCGPARHLRPQQLNVVDHSSGVVMRNRSLPLGRCEI